MKKSRATTEFSVQDIQKKISQAEELVKKLFSRYVQVTADELITYFSAESPYGDVTTVNDVLESKWLLIHELVELSILKIEGVKIDRRVLLDYMSEVNRAHVRATECELRAAFDALDFNYIRERLKHIDYWIEDEDMEKYLRDRCKEIKREYNEKIKGKNEA